MSERERALPALSAAALRGINLVFDRGRYLACSLADGAMPIMVYMRRSHGGPSLRPDAELDARMLPSLTSGRGRDWLGHAGMRA